MNLFNKFSFFIVSCGTFFFLTGCDFKQIYNKKDVNSLFQHCILIEKYNDKYKNLLAKLIKNNPLIYNTQQPCYNVKMDIKFNTSNAITAQNTFITRQNLTLYVKFKLLNKNKVLLNLNMEQHTSYNITNQGYSNMMLENKLKNSLTDKISEEIIKKIIIFSQN